MVRGEGIENRVEFKMVQGKIGWVTSETRIKWRGNEYMERQMNTDADLISCGDSRKVSSSFAVNDRGNRGGSKRCEDRFLGNEPVGKMGMDEEMVIPVHGPFIYKGFMFAPRASDLGVQNDFRVREENVKVEGSVFIFIAKG